MKMIRLSCSFTVFLPLYNVLKPVLVCLEIRNQYAHGSWEEFNELLDKTPPLNGEQYACGAFGLRFDNSPFE